MKVTGKELFPLGEIIVKEQLKKSRIEKELVIVNDPDNNVAGSCNHETNVILLNIAKFGNPELALRYGIPDGPNQTAMIGAAVAFEECYHAANYETPDNTEELATIYGSVQATKLPEEIIKMAAKSLLSSEKPLELPFEPDEEKQPEDEWLELSSGSMVEFINQVANRGPIDIHIETKFGIMSIKNDEHVTEVNHTTDIQKLNNIKKTLGNITKAGIEYAGMIYVYEDEKWSIYVDLDENRMTEVNDPTYVCLTKNEERRTISLKK